MHLFHDAFCRLLLVAVLFLLPVSVSAEVIRSFDSAIQVNQNGSLKVEETIEYDFEDAFRHGIFRTIPLEHPQDASAWYKDRYIEINVESVLLDGTSVPHEVSRSGGALEIKIGDPDRTITGLHAYVITYTVRGALFYGEQAAELYWNVTGNNWNVSVLETRATVSAQPGVLALEGACYIGVPGGTERCRVTTLDEDSAVFSGSVLASGEGMTIAQALNPALVEVVILESFSWAIFFLVGGGLLFVGFFIGIYRVHTRHKIHGSVIAQYEPYEGVRPMYAGVLVDGTLHPHDITAGIVYLAEQGFLKITKMNKKFLFFNTSDYGLQLTKDTTIVPSTFLLRVLELLFGSDMSVGRSVKLSDMKWDFSKQHKNKKIFAELQKAITEDMHIQGFFEYVIPAVWTRRTRKGYEAKNHLKGFKEFLSVTGKNRFIFHNAPEKNPQQFLEYLPYAIAFGVEKEWASVFEGVTIPNPSWYEGGHAGAFSAALFASDMNTFSQSLGSSSGASAASGGGSAGGGAGGGGGGSW